MRFARPVVTVALLSAMAGVGSAEAAKAPVCNLITDPVGDADIQSGVGNDSALDITSVDLASDAKNLTVVIRVDKAALKSSVYPAGALKFTTNFTVGDAQYFTSVLSDSDVSGNFGTVGTGSNTILTFPAAVIDTKTNEIRISVPKADFPSPFKTGDVFSAITGRTSSAVVKIATPAVNGSTGGLGIDSATSDATYKAGAKNCVTVGK